MSNDLWNDEIAYIFSSNRTFMRILGMWPPQKKTIFTIMQWSLTTILQLTSFIFMFMELNGNHHDTGASIDNILFITCTTACVLKKLCITANKKKLAKNIDAAISDWSTAKNDKNSYQIMKKFAYKSKLFNLIMMSTCSVGCAIYVIAVIFMNMKQIFSQNENVSEVNINTTDWMFIIPSGELGSKIMGPLYAVLIVLQSFQLIVIGMTQCTTDVFYIIIILHLAGQLKVLKTRFKTFSNKSNSDINDRKQLVSLINRHCELMELNQNLEDTFHLTILYQLVIVTVLLALLGLRIIFCLRENDYIILVKSVIAINFVFLESLIYTYGGDFIQRESEGILYAMFTTSWFTFPAALMKDLHFAMMKSSHSFHLTGGKFFYANRETMVNVLKTAASYISVLRVALLKN